MKVTGTGPNSTDKARDVTGAGSAAAASGTREKKRATKSHATDAGSTDKVEISAKAKDAVRAQNIARGAPDVDEAKVARLKAAIQNGSYKVDADKVADRLVDEHLATSF